MFRLPFHCAHNSCVGTKSDLEWYGGMINYDNSSTEALLTAVANYVHNVNDPKSALLLGFVNLIQDSKIVTMPSLTAFYHGTELPASIFGEFLAIPSISSQLNSLSYIDISSIFDAQELSGAGFGRIFGASSFNGLANQYINAFRNWNNYTLSINDTAGWTALEFTPILNTQIIAGRANGGNAINAPDGSYASVVVQAVFPASTTSISPVIERAHDYLLKQISPNTGLPLFLNECSKNQNIFATYGDYQFLRDTYAKYDPTRFNIRFTDGPIGL